MKTSVVKKKEWTVTWVLFGLLDAQNNRVLSRSRWRSWSSRVSWADKITKVVCLTCLPEVSNLINWD